VTFGYKSEPQNALNIIDQRVREMVRQQGLPYSNGSIPQQAVAIPRVTALPKVAQEGDEVFLLIDGGADLYLYLRSIPGWVRVSDTVPSVAPATTLPSDPAEGDTFIYDTGTSGVRWQFVYDTTDGSTYPWLFIGGPPLSASTAAATDNDTSFGAPDTGSVPSITLPLAGDYVADWGCLGFNDTGGQVSRIAMFQTTNLVATDAASIEIGNDTSYQQAHKKKTFTGLAAAALTMQVRVTGGNADFQNIELAVTPVRVG
jgi:hypothetical protein